VVPAGLRGAPNEYTAYLETEHWQNTRRSALLIARYRCAECHSNDSLEVHHLHYRTLGRENVLTDLRVLCATCHERVHAGHGWKRTRSGNWVRFFSGGECITVFLRDAEYADDPWCNEWCFVMNGEYSSHTYSSAGAAMDAAMGWAE
jgi:hypothetical protein